MKENPLSETLPDALPGAAWLKVFDRKQYLAIFAFKALVFFAAELPFLLTQNPFTGRAFKYGNLTIPIFLVAFWRNRQFARPWDLVALGLMTAIEIWTISIYVHSPF